VVKNQQNISIYATLNSIQLWSVTTNKYDELAISSSGEYIVWTYTLFGTSYVHLCNNFSSTPIWTFETENEVRNIDISEDGTHIVAAGGSGSEGIVYLFTTTSSIPLWENKEIFAWDDNTLDLSGNGDYFVVADGSDRICLFHKASPQPIWTNPCGIHPQGEATNLYGSISSSGKDIVAARSNLLFFFNAESPFTIESFILSYILIFSFLGVLSTYLSFTLLKNHYQRKKLLEKEISQREDLQKILQYSNRVSKTMVRTILGIEKSTFDKQISKWATEFGFKVDDNFIFINKDELPDFIKELDEKFEDWRDLKKKKKV